jgi:D-alanyl-D-alanine carboxypeptidase (penicillin-binding protein 5/6)
MHGERQFGMKTEEVGIASWRILRLVVLASMALIGGWLVMTGSARAAQRAGRKPHRVARAASRAPLYRGALLEDADTGKVLFETNADMQWPPASMAKMMLVLVAEDQIKEGRFSLNDPVRISERAAKTGGSRLGLREGQVYPLGELIKAAVIKSANDAAVAIAEKVAGSVEACVRMMNERARKLDMMHTAYRTVDGLPPRPAHDADVTTARDLAKVARALIHQTEILQWTGQETAMFDEGELVLHNTNHLIGHFEGCDGLKTGFTYQAGFNLTGTAKRGDMRLVAVILGAPCNAERFRQAAKLMEWGFDNFRKVSVIRQGQPLPVHVQVESGPLIQPIAASDVKLLVPKDEVNEIGLQYSVPETVSAPVVDGEPLGEVIVYDGSRILAKVNAICSIPGRGDRLHAQVVPAVDSDRAGERR